MVDLATKKEIENVAYQLLKSSKAFDKFPTPVADIVAHADLVVDAGIDLSNVERSFFSRFSNIGNVLAKVRGLLYRKERIIVLDMSQQTSRKHFVMLHECGHDILQWQKEVFDFIDDDNTLNPDVREQFEAEANYFASATLFQLDRFEKELQSLPLEINSGMYLSKKFGSSIHAALRRFVEISKKRCSLLVLEKDDLAGKQALYKARDYFQSNAFSKEFGDVTWPEKLGYTWKFVQEYYFGRKMTKGIVELITEGGPISFQYEFFNNSFNGFVLFYPISEKTLARTKFLIKQ